MKKDKKITTREAAEIIGCSHSHARYLARTGAVESTVRQVTPGFAVHEVSLASAKKYAKTVSNQGWKRGRSRKES